MEKIVFSLLGYASGFVFSARLWGQTEGMEGVIANLRFTLLGKEIALHHWMLFLALILLLLLFRSKIGLSDRGFYFILGLLFGGLNHGLTYKDWFNVI